MEPLTRRKDSALRFKIQFDWWLVGVCLARTFNGLVFMTYAATLPVLQKEWGMTAAAAGTIAGGFQLGYAVSLVIFSFLADRFCPKRLYLGSMTACAVCALLFAGWARDYVSGLVLYMFTALAMGGNYTTGLIIIAHRYPIEKRGRAMGFFIASTSLGYAISLILSGAAMPAGGYKLAFWLTCSGPAVGAVLAWITLYRTFVGKPLRAKGQRFGREILRNRPVMTLIGGYTGHSWEILGMWAWTPTFLAAVLAVSGYEGIQAVGKGVHLTAGLHLMGLTASFTMGWLSDRLGRAPLLVGLAGVSTLCSFSFGWTIGLPFSIVILVGTVYAFSGLGDSPILSATLTESVNVSYMGAAFGLRSVLGFGAGAISPVVLGAVLDLTNPGITETGVFRNWGWAFSVLGVGGLGAWLAAIYFALTRKNLRDIHT
ncbi:MAG: MFS transporter [Desulfobacterales bacterium]|jgi:MFS family permease